jgi:hypothetical protein
LNGILDDYFRFLKRENNNPNRYPISLITPKKYNRCIGVNLRKNPKNFCLSFWVQIKKGVLFLDFFENILEGVYFICVIKPPSYRKTLYIGGEYPTGRKPAPNGL